MFCNFCPRKFGSPSAYAQHLESGTHGVSRHQVTRAVHSLQIIPPIAIVQAVELPTARVMAIEERGEHGMDIDAPEPPTVEPSSVVPGSSESRLVLGPLVPGPPLSAREAQVSQTAFTTTPGPTPTEVTYFPIDFSTVTVPYSCPFCAKTFRSIAGLTAHMNSPTHDPNAFLCPKCAKQFALVSGLIQHLESGTCGLASKEEVFFRFAMITGQFMRLLT